MQQRGFTLIEVLLVAAILGILVSIAIAFFPNYDMSSEPCAANVRSVETAVGLWQAAGNDLNALDSFDPLIGQYLTAPPVCPKNKVPYTIISGNVYCPVHSPAPEN